MTLAQLHTYILGSNVLIEMKQSTHSGHLISINGHVMFWTPRKLARLDKAALDKLIEKNYSLTPDKTPKKKWE